MKNSCFQPKQEKSLNILVHLDYWMNCCNIALSLCYLIIGKHGLTLNENPEFIFKYTCAFKRYQSSSFLQLDDPFYYFCAADLMPKFNSTWCPTWSTVTIAIQNAICLQMDIYYIVIHASMIFTKHTHHCRHYFLLGTSAVVYITWSSFSVPAGPFSMI